MAQVLVRDLDEEVVERLKARARAHSRSLEGELRIVLEQAARAYVDMTAAREDAEAIRRRLEGRAHTESTQLLAEDRAR